MQEHPITLADIRHEAMLLELDVDISTGRLDIFKRSDASTGYYSLQEVDDPRVLITAWQFLQFYRAQLDALDEARREIANHPPRRSRPARAVLTRALGFALALAGGVATVVITDDSLLALLVFIVLFCLVPLVVALVPVRKKGAAHGGGR